MKNPTIYFDTERSKIIIPDISTIDIDDENIEPPGIYKSSCLNLY
jgi:hypothetical protein